MSLEKKSSYEFHLKYLITDRFANTKSDWTPEVYEKLKTAKYLGKTPEGYFLNKDEFEKLGRPKKIVVERTDVVREKK